MTKEELKDRTKKFALRVIKLIAALPRTTAAKAIGNQLIRSGTSVGANYRAACRARSMAEFTAKLGVVIEEADESAFWIELIIDGKIMKETLAKPLLDEANELVAIFSSSVISIKEKKINHTS